MRSCSRGNDVKPRPESEAGNQYRLRLVPRRRASGLAHGGSLK
jgi:hypothetical protein